MAKEQAKKDAQQQQQYTNNSNSNSTITTSNSISTSTSSSNISRVNGDLTTNHNQVKTAHDWQYYKRRNKNEIYDDRTMTYFWRAHNITALVIVVCVLVYVALLEQPSADSSYNTKRGLFACVTFFLLFGVIYTPDGPFIRPHPALWRLVLCFSLVYEMVLVYILFQTVDDARQLVKHLDPKLGVPLPDKDYGGNCLIYDPENQTDPWHNLRDKMDGFVTTHFFGWWLKTLILRDWWLCMVISVGFEVLEYSLEHQLPNFSECWWDHWLLDVAVCNQFGIFLGMKTCQYFSMKPYNWRGMWNIPTFKGKLMRVINQFSPYSWIEYDWRPKESLKRWLAMIGILVVFFLAELGTFYLKFILWIPPPHFLCLGRLVFLWLAGAVSMREAFEYLDNPECKKFGRQAWMVVCIVMTEVLIVLKFDWKTVTKPLPMHISIFWIVFISIIVLWTIWNFYVKPYLHWQEKKIDKKNGIHHQQTKKTN